MDGLMAIDAKGTAQPGTNVSAFVIETLVITKTRTARNIDLVEPRCFGMR